MTLGRREFLQRLGASLATLGIADAALAGVCDRYQQALAAASRCFALLVGINAYPATTWQEGATLDKGAPLQGAVMDVELQKELLIHRFGVAPQNILTLLDEQATTEAILNGMQTHLLAQAQPGDAVVFHFSGLGGQAQLTELPGPLALPTLVTSNSFLPRKDTPEIQDLFEETLAQLLGTLTGVEVLTVIDASSAPQPAQLIGNFRVRSRPKLVQGTWSAPRAVAYTGIAQPVQDLRRLSETWPGSLFRANAIGLPALEGSWHNFSAGLFTYALTQQLWHNLPSQRQSWTWQKVEQTISTWTGTGQRPQWQGKSTGERVQGLPLPMGLEQPEADGVVKAVDLVNRTATLWLGGMAPDLLTYGSFGLRLQPAPSQSGGTPNTGVTLVVKAVDGLRAKADCLDITNLPVGIPLIEVERRLPREMALVVALDPNLERIERVDATSALAGLANITAVAPGEQAADCLFARLLPGEPLAAVLNMTPDAETPIAVPSLEAELLYSQLGYGLFTPGRQLIPGTVSAEGEAVKKSIGRLTTPLHSLLALKLLRLTLNQGSSQLPLSIVVEGFPVANSQLLVDETWGFRPIGSRPLTQPERFLAKTAASPQMQKYQIRLRGGGQQPLYYLLLAVLEGMRVFVYCPPAETPAELEQPVASLEDSMQLLSGQTLSFSGIAEGGWGNQPIEIFAIAALRPFTTTWQAIRTPEFGQLSDRWAIVADPLPIAKAILRDLNQASLNPNETAANPSDSYFTLRSHAWATVTLRLPVPIPEGINVMQKNKRKTVASQTLKSRNS